ncbi:SURF1 family cytochrome oxidase biogenesis protein [Marisediminicola senii]|uniref:SURF1 family cytochrome oxidase biogenesis protein n=1 Tax=Marisediminicola senii TaxID=2711233 RepID=UPI0013EA060A|nr:SURF1 family protein [Marisediminicola senii]
MTGWRFAFSRRWAGYLALTIVFAIICSLLATWQFSRRADARAEIDRIDQNYDSQPIAVDQVLPSLESFDDDQKWTRVTLTGQYLTDDELLVRNRPYGGRPGFELLTPMLLDDGTVFVVDRGWLPTGSQQDAPDEVPPAPTGEVTVTARLKASEPTLSGRSTVEGSNQIPTVHLPQIADKLDRPTYTGAYGLIAAGSPGAGDAEEALPILSARPARDEGPHLSYAFQWYVFAILAFIGLGWALRQEYRLVNSDDPDEIERASERDRRKAARTPSDDESEDAIIEALAERR